MDYSTKSTIELLVEDFFQSKGTMLNAFYNHEGNIMRLWDVGMRNLLLEFPFSVEEPSKEVVEEELGIMILLGKIPILKGPSNDP